MVAPTSNIKDSGKSPTTRLVGSLKWVKSLSLILIFVIGLLTNTSAQELKELFHKHSPRVSPTTLVTDEDFSNYDVTFYGLDIEIFPDTESLAGFVDIGLTFTESSEEFRLALFPPLTIDSVQVQGIPNPQFSQTDARSWIHTIDLGQEFSSGTPLVARVFYSGAPNQSYESIVFSENAGQPHIWTLSEPYGAMHWFPLKNVPSDKADSAYINVTVPNPLFVASNGLLEAEIDLPTDRTRFEWKTGYPIAMYLISLAIGDFQVFEDDVQIGNKTMPFVNYVYKEFNPTDFLNAVNKTKPMLPYFGELFGEYPFADEKYGHASFEFRGGMEHQTLSSMGTFNESIIAHELVHQWFGNTVTCASFDHIWINEGFATYGEGLWVEETVSEQAFRDWRTGLISLINSENSGSVVKSEQSVDFVNNSHVSTIFNYRLTYAKGAMVVHGLRTLLGDNLFFEASTALVQETYRHQSIDTEQVKEHFESYYGASLDFFFDEWVYGTGFPNYLGNFESNSSGITKVIIEQTPSAGAGLFTTPFEVRFYNEVRDTTVTLLMNQLQQSWEFQFDFSPESALIDPDNDWLIGQKRLVFAPVDEAIGYVPQKTIIRSVYPNPFNPETNISFEIAQSGPVTIELIDISGRSMGVLFSGNLAAGVYNRRVQPNNVASGRYFLRLTSRGQSHLQTITYLK